MVKRIKARANWHAFPAVTPAALSRPFPLHQARGRHHRGDRRRHERPRAGIPGPAYGAGQEAERGRQAEERKEIREFLRLPGRSAPVPQTGRGAFAMPADFSLLKEFFWHSPTRLIQTPETSLLPSAPGKVIQKGSPAPAANRKRGRHGAVSAPVHGCRRDCFFTTPTRHQRAGVNGYLASDARSRTRAAATSKAKTSFRMAAPSFTRLRRADACPEGSRAVVMLSQARGGVQLRCRRGLRSARRKLESENPPFASRCGFLPEEPCSLPAHPESSASPFYTAKS